jgi:DNA invertase Pin-like site-specific DNA recombinase
MLIYAYARASIKDKGVKLVVDNLNGSDLTSRVKELVLKGMTKAEVAKQLNIGESTFYKYPAQ